MDSKDLQEKVKLETVNSIKEYEMDLEERLDRMQDDVMIQKSTKLLDETVALIKARDSYPELPTGFPILDEIIHGLLRSTITVIAGRPGMGKSSFATNIAYNLAVHSRKNVLYLTIEMTKKQIMERIISRFCKVDGNDLRKGDIPPDFDERVERLHKALEVSSLTICEEIGYKWEEIIKAVEICKIHKCKPDVIFIDHITKIPSIGTANKRETVSTYMGEIEKLAKREGIAIVAISQLNREAKKGTQPTMDQLRESGALEQDAATILLCWWQNDEEGSRDPSKTPYKILVEKQRFGDAPLKIELRFFANLALIEDPTVKSEVPDEFQDRVPF